MEGTTTSGVGIPGEIYRLDSDYGTKTGTTITGFYFGQLKRERVYTTNSEAQHHILPADLSIPRVLRTRPIGTGSFPANSSHLPSPRD